MLSEYLLDSHEILAPRVERRLDDESWRDVRDFTKELHDMESSFVPEASNCIDLSIYSSREFARSYRESPVNSKVRITDSDFHLDWFSKDVKKIPGFSDTAIAEIDGIIINKVNDKILFGMKLDSRRLAGDRKGTVNSNKRLTHVNLGWELSDLIFGWVYVKDSNSARTARQVRDMGQILLRDNYFNVQFEPGTVDNHIVDLFD